MDGVATHIDHIICEVMVLVLACIHRGANVATTDCRELPIDGNHPRGVAHSYDDWHIVEAAYLSLFVCKPT